MAPQMTTTEVMFAAGSGVYTAPAGTTEPADPSVTPIATWKNLGYVTEDGVTLTKSPSTSPFGAWQAQDPIILIETGRVQTLGYALRQWNPTTLTHAFGGTAGTAVGPPPTGSFTPSQVPPVATALLFRWLWDTYATQLWCPRGVVSGDVAAVLARTAPADLPVTFTATPSGAEPPWKLNSLNPAFVTPLALAADEGGFDPGAHTVAEVLDYVAENPDERATVLALEAAGQNRSTLVAQLQGAA